MFKTLRDFFFRLAGPSHQRGKSSSAQRSPADFSWVENVQTIVRHGPKHICTQCGQRNDIENLCFCANCMTSWCWQCGRGVTHCRECGQPIRLIDEWIKLAREAKPGSI
jgi:hypothetical protein